MNRWASSIAREEGVNTAHRLHIWPSPLSAVVLVAALAIVSCISPSSIWAGRAYADELAGVAQELQEKTDELERLTDEIADAQDKLDEIDGELASLLSDVNRLQGEHAHVQAELSKLAIDMYKNPDNVNAMVIVASSDSWMEIEQRMQLRKRVLNRYGELSMRQEQTQRDLEERYSKVSQQKDAQVLLIKEQKERKDELNQTIKDLEEQQRHLSAEQQAQLAEAAAAAHKIAQTFDTADVAGVYGATGDRNPVAGTIDTGWRVGLASAYGGSSDPYTPNPGTTATGALCNDWTVGVAVPMAWGPAPYYGRKVEISYNGQSFIATVNDCGGMNNGERALDLQPGVFKAFGFKTCDEWGVRTVRYRFL